MDRLKLDPPDDADVDRLTFNVAHYQSPKDGSALTTPTQLNETLNEAIESNPIYRLAVAVRSATRLEMRLPVGTIDERAGEKVFILDECTPEDAVREAMRRAMEG